MTDDELRVDTPQYTWCFDRLRQRFRRLPRGRDPRDPAVQADWEPYSRLWRGADGALTVLLDSAGTLRLRVVGLTRRWRVRDAAPDPVASDVEPPAELDLVELASPEPRSYVA
ncbi:MAG TPA: hypothetical protein VIH82_04615 [Acidimicrobiia bacterium]|jgi:hypothetical protein